MLELAILLHTTAPLHSAALTSRLLDMLDYLQSQQHMTSSAGASQPSWSRSEVDVRVLLTRTFGWCILRCYTVAVWFNSVCGIRYISFPASIGSLRQSPYIVLPSNLHPVFRHWLSTTTTTPSERASLLYLLNSCLWDPPAPLAPLLVLRDPHSCPPPTRRSDIAAVSSRRE